jgi:hypothetical protein
MAVDRCDMHLFLR